TTMPTTVCPRSSGPTSPPSSTGAGPRAAYSCAPKPCGGAAIAGSSPTICWPGTCRCPMCSVPVISMRRSCAQPPRSTPTAPSRSRRTAPGADSRSRWAEAAPVPGCRLGGGEVIGAGSGLADDLELVLRGDLVADAHDSTVAAGGLDVTGQSDLTAIEVASG